MIKSFFKIAWRNLVRDRLFSLLNLVGLSVGLACALLIYLWINSERSMDTFHEKGDRLYQVMQNSPPEEGDVQTMESTPDLLAKTLKEELPGIEESVVIKTPDPDGPDKGIISVNDARIKAREMFVTPNFFDVFTYKLIEGNKDQVLSAKENVLLSEGLAMKLFHSTHDIIGRTVAWDRGSAAFSPNMNGNYVVSGVFENPPANSSQQFDLLFTHALYFSTITHDIGWFSSTPSTYLLVKEGTNVPQLNEKIKNFIKNKFKPGTQEYKWAGTFFLQPYKDKYLYNHYENGQIAGGRIAYVQLFSIISIAILLIACINFMNLSTARAARRIKVVGIKKVMGATRMSLILQYLGESMLMTMASLVIACVLAAILLPAFEGITGKSIGIHFQPGIVLSVVCITVVTGLLAGSYPALYLSGFKPVLVLKGGVEQKGGESFVRKSLVVFQFGLSAILIVTVLVVYGQMQLIQSKNLGYSKDNIVRLSNEGGIQPKQVAFLTEVRTLQGVVYASDMEGNLLDNHSSGGGVDWPGKTQRVEFDGLYVDYDLMETIGLQMKEGRSFSRSYGTDKDAVILNETAIARMNFPNPIGKTVSLWGSKKKVIGVVKDFNYESLYRKVGPLFLAFRDNNPNIFVKIKAGKEKETLSELASAYKKFNPGLPFEFSFLDKDYQALYSSEEKVALLSRYFAGIAILISCLGLFGLAAFTAQRRQKEIGIRKVVGASVRDVIVLLSRDALKLTLIAIVIACPLSGWMMYRWLQGFAYRIHVGAGVFLTAAAVLIVITLLTISFQSIKAAVANPVNALKND